MSDHQRISRRSAGAPLRVKSGPPVFLPLLLFLSSTICPTAGHRLKYEDQHFHRIGLRQRPNRWQLLDLLLHVER
jgi:hypothetical protein